MTFVSPVWRLRLMKWHRWLTLVLVAQLAIWLATALVMTLIERSSISAYAPQAQPSFDAVSAWPELDALQSAMTSGASEVELQKQAAMALIGTDASERLALASLMPAAQMSEADIAAYASKLTEESISEDSVSLKTNHSPEYQKLPLPAWRVEANKAVLFFDPVSGELLSQTTSMKFLENLMKSIHVMDYSGRGEFKRNWLLTLFALLFMSASISGVLAVKRIYLKRKAVPTSQKIHQVLGLALFLQVFFWVSSGLGVAWLLHPLRDTAESILVEKHDPIAWANVKFHPRDIYVAGSDETRPVRIKLKMLLDQPVYQVAWTGRNPKQALWSAENGRTITLTEADRDRIAKLKLIPSAYKSLEKWTVAEGFKDLDFYFYAGPYPVWKGYFTAPRKGAVAIDQVTGHVHTPRTGEEIFLERYYNVHVVNWRLRVIQYRREPALLIVIGLAFLLLITGSLMHIRRLRAKKK